MTDGAHLKQATDLHWANNFRVQPREELVPVKCTGCPFPSVRPYSVVLMYPALLMKGNQEKQKTGFSQFGRLIWS